VEAPKLAVTPPPADKPAASRPAMVPVMPQEHKPALTNFTESPAPTVSPVPTVAKGAAAKTSTPTTSNSRTRNFDSVFKMPAQRPQNLKTADVKAESKSRE